MEESSQVWKEESCGDRVQHDEVEAWWKSQFQRRDGTTKRAVDQGGPAQHRTIELLGVRWEVTYSTGPVEKKERWREGMLISDSLTR